MKSETIGARICYLRKKSGKTQKQLANELYVSQETISSWERNRTRPDTEMLICLTSALHTTLNYLITGKALI